MNKKLQMAVHQARNQMMVIQMQVDVGGMSDKDMKRAVVDVKEALNYIWGQCMCCLGNEEFEMRVEPEVLDKNVQNRGRRL